MVYWLVFLLPAFPSPTLPQALAPTLHPQIQSGGLWLWVWPTWSCPYSPLPGFHWICLHIKMHFCSLAICSLVGDQWEKKESVTWYWLDFLICMCVCVHIHLQLWPLNACVTLGMERKKAAAAQTAVQAQIRWRNPGLHCLSVRWLYWWSSCSPTFWKSWTFVPMY